MTMDAMAPLLDKIAAARQILSESRFAEAAALAQTLRVEANAANDEMALANTMEIEGLARCHMSEYVAARALGEAAMGLYEQGDDLPGQARALNLLGILHRELGDPALALEYHQRQLAICTKIDDREYLIKAYNGIAGVYAFTDDHAQAQANLNTVIELATQAGDWPRVAVAYANLLQVFSADRNLGGAQETIDRAIAMHDQLGESISADHRAHFCSRAARYFLAIGQLDRALAFADSGLAIIHEMPLHRRRAVLLGDRGAILLNQGRIGQALQSLYKSHRLAVEFRFEQWMRGTFDDLRIAYERLGDYQAAYLWQQRAHELRLQVLDADRTRAVQQVEARYRVQQARIEAEQYRQQLAVGETKRHALERLNHLKDELLATTSHDIKNPLASIRLTLSLLRRDDSGDPLNRARHLNHIDEQVERISRLIGNLLDLAKLETAPPLDMRPIATTDLLAWAARQHIVRAAEKNIRLEVSPAPYSVNLLADLERLQQVMDNLVSNAIKYTPAGGVVSLEAQEEGEMVRISVRDTGLGIPAEALPNIFDPFFRVSTPEHRAEDGTGLGLAITETIIKQHGASMSVESSLGQGSTFTFALPKAVPTSG